MNNNSFDIKLMTVKLVKTDEPALHRGREILPMALMILQYLKVCCGNVDKEYSCCAGIIIM